MTSTAGNEAPMTKEVSEPRRRAPFPCGYCGRSYSLPRPRACCSRGREFDIKVIAVQTGNHVNEKSSTRSKVETLLKALKYLQRHYVGQLENARDRIRQLGGECDPVDVMEARDPHLRQVREVIASVESSADEP